MKISKTMRLEEETIRLMNITAERNGISMARANDGIWDMVYGNFVLEDIDRHLKSMEFKDYRAGRTYSKNKD